LSPENFRLNYAVSSAEDESFESTEEEATNEHVESRNLQQQNEPIDRKVFYSAFEKATNNDNSTNSERKRRVRALMHDKFIIETILIITTCRNTVSVAGRPFSTSINERQ
jgi:hypothetical protein